MDLYSFSFSNPSGAEVRIVVVDKDKFEQTFSPTNIDRKVWLNIKPKWNLLSMSIETNDFVNLENLAIGKFWGWNNENGAYYSLDKPVAGQGFWLYANISQPETVSFIGKDAEVTPSLSAGWNLAGPLKNSSVPENVESIFSWDEKYDSLINRQNLLVEGNGYWYFLSE